MNFQRISRTLRWHTTNTWRNDWLIAQQPWRHVPAARQRSANRAVFAEDVRIASRRNDILFKANTSSSISRDIPEDESAAICDEPMRWSNHDGSILVSSCPGLSWPVTALSWRHFRRGRHNRPCHSSCLRQEPDRTCIDLNWTCIGCASDLFWTCTGSRPGYIWIWDIKRQIKRQWNSEVGPVTWEGDENVLLMSCGPIRCSVLLVNIHDCYLLYLVFYLQL